MAPARASVADAAVERARQDLAAAAVAGRGADAQFRVRAAEHGTVLRRLRMAADRDHCAGWRGDRVHGRRNQRGRSGGHRDCVSGNPDARLWRAAEGHQAAADGSTPQAAVGRRAARHARCAGAARSVRRAGADRFLRRDGARRNGVGVGGAGTQSPRTVPRRGRRRRREEGVRFRAAAMGDAAPSRRRSHGLRLADPPLHRSEGGLRVRR